MRYVLTNNDGTIEIMGCRPYEIIRNSDGAVFSVMGSRKRDGKRVLYGAFPGTDGSEFIVGNEDFDPADMEPTSIPGHTCVFNTIEREKSKRHPATAAKITGGRKTTKQELIASGMGFIDDKGRVRVDHTHRSAWKDDAGKIIKDTVKAAAIDEKRKLDAAVADELKAEHEARVERVRARLK